MANPSWSNNAQALDYDLNNMNLAMPDGYSDGGYQANVSTTITPAAYGLQTTDNTYGSYNNSNLLSPTGSAPMYYSHSASSSGSNGQASLARSTSRRLSDAEAAAISHKYNNLLSQLQPGTEDYNKVLKSYHEWYAEYNEGTADGVGSAERESPSRSSQGDEDDLNSGIYAVDTPSGPSYSQVVQIIGKDGRPRKAYTCPYSDCKSQPSRKADLERHINSMHRKNPDRLHLCPEPGCARIGHRGFTRKDHLIEHLRNLHHKEGDFPKRPKGRKD